ncbi:hypothetical protein KAR91_42780 [Candidatus Pacearchaeota archaeon]|nr:hypothetical protein [Candidatus Pacearchaeota archaeon]
MEPIFEVIDGDKHYKIYENGEIEGFGDDVTIFNRIPTVFATKLANKNPYMPEYMKGKLRDFISRCSKGK